MNTFSIIMLSVGILAGFALGWALTGMRAAKEKARADELEKIKSEAAEDFAMARERLSTAERAESELKVRLEETNVRLEEQKAFISEAQKQFKDAFEALASQALKSSNKSFLELAEEKFKGLRSDAEGALEARKTAVETLVKPLGEALDKYQKQARELEEKRSKEMGSVGEQLRTLSHETSSLANALKKPQVRGRWGEIALRNVIELAGMTKYCDFYEQVSAEADGIRIRPDVEIKYPSGRHILIDSKTPLEAYQEAFESSDDETRKSALERHLRNVKEQVSQLSSKEYWSFFDDTIDAVVMFIPHDSFLVAAVNLNPGLIEDALSKKVLIATPSTLLALLKAIHLGWKEAQLAENAKEISRLGQELYDRVAVVSQHLGSLGKSLEDSVDRYNKAMRSIETRLYPSAKKFKELGVITTKELESAPEIDLAPRRTTVIKQIDTEEFK